MIIMQQNRNWALLASAVLLALVVAVTVFDAEMLLPWG
jgi:hypothetical protein